MKKLALAAVLATTERQGVDEEAAIRGLLQGIDGTP